MARPPVEVYRRFRITYSLHLQIIRESQANSQEASRNLLLVARLTYSSTLMMVAVPFSETSVDLYRTARRNIPESNILQNHRSENLKSEEIGTS
jgi:hypothetical protein